MMPHLSGCVQQSVSCGRSRNNSLRTRQPSRRRGDQAMGVYRECRDKLVGFLVSLQPAGRSAASVDSKPVGVWMMGTNQRAAGSDDGAFGRRDEVQVLAYRLWERAGHAIGSPDEHWYRAEELLRSGQ